MLTDADNGKSALQSYYHSLADELISQAVVAMNRIKKLIFWYAKLPLYLSAGGLALSVLLAITLPVPIPFVGILVGAIQTFWAYSVYDHFLLIDKIIKNKLIDTPSERLRDISAPNDETDRALATAIYKFAQTMLITSNDIKIMLDCENFAFFPTIKHYQNRDCIIIPIGWAWLYHTLPDRAYALLAHELGHVRQKDLILWTVTEILIGRLYEHAKRRVVFATAWTMTSVLLVLAMRLYLSKGLFSPSFVDQLLDCCKEVTPALIGISFFIYIYREATRVRQLVLDARMQSEHTADVAALAFTKGSAIIDVLKEYLSDFDTSYVHPKKEERLLYLNGLSRGDQIE